MQEIHSAIQALLPSRRKTTPSGWTAVNAPCCHHRGHTVDTRQRGGIILAPDGGFTFHCFNCNFKTGWRPGNLLSTNTRSLFRWLGMSTQEIQKLNFLAMRIQTTDTPTPAGIVFHLEPRTLPDQAKPLAEWMQSADSEQSAQIQQVVDYLTGRGMNLDWYNWHWSPISGYQDRVIIPFYNNRQIIGWTARKITEGRPKYLTSSQPGYVFNLDQQTQEYDRQFVVVVEGQMDAIAVDGVAIMTNEVNATQAARITALNRQVIVVPDRDRAGARILNAALTHGWAVSNPPWEKHIKDTADAVNHYGRLYTLTTILHYRDTNKIKIQLLKRQLERLNG
jgi:5S rRNA maturation endonuclease (ribonuclease M5)